MASKCFVTPPQIKTKKQNRIAELEDAIEEKRQERDEFVNGDIGDRRRITINLIRNSNVPFVGLDGNRYAAGIKAIKRRLSGLSGERTTDRIGTRAIKGYLRSLIREKEEALAFARFTLKNWEDLQADCGQQFLHQMYCQS